MIWLLPFRAPVGEPPNLHLNVLDYITWSLLAAHVDLLALALVRSIGLAHPTFSPTELGAHSPALSRVRCFTRSNPAALTPHPAAILRECAVLPLDLRPDHVFGIRGTETHVGSSGQTEEGIFRGRDSPPRPVGPTCRLTLPSQRPPLRSRGSSASKLVWIHHKLLSGLLAQGPEAVVVHDLETQRKERPSSPDPTAIVPAKSRPTAFAPQEGSSTRNSWISLLGTDRTSRPDVPRVRTTNFASYRS